MSEVKESKIKQILGVREHNGQHGKTFYFTAELENGEKGGGISRKAENGLKIGDTLKYTNAVHRGSAEFKEVRENRGGFGGGAPRANPAAIAAAVALKSATEIVVANINASGQPLGMNGELTGKITSLADGLYTWLRNKENA